MPLGKPGLPQISARQNVCSIRESTLIRFDLLGFSRIEVLPIRVSSVAIRGKNNLRTPWLTR
jgi:hypothetical protein